MSEKLCSLVLADPILPKNLQNFTFFLQNPPVCTSTERPRNLRFIWKKYFECVKNYVIFKIESAKSNFILNFDWLRSIKYLILGLLWIHVNHVKLLMKLKNGSNNNVVSNASAFLILERKSLFRFILINLGCAGWGSQS